MQPFLLPDAPVPSADEYLAAGGGTGIARAIELGPEQTIKEVTLARLRGRGGAGFPTGRKWTTIAAQAAAAPTLPRYVVCNAAEGEPATFKDRLLMRRNPFQLVEGVVIAGFAIGATEAYLALKASFTEERERVLQAIEELQRAGVCERCTVTVAEGPDEYLFGEETALLEVVEGRAPLPRNVPSYQTGLFADANPTLVNNAETLSNVPHILARGAEWFRTMGTADSPGNVVVTVVGDTVRAGVAEVELGTPLADVLSSVGGGVAEGRTIKAVISGVANAVLTADQLSTPMTYEDLRGAGSGMGAAGFAVFDDSACMVEVARQLSRFLAVESCGQCPPCKLGSQAITDSLTRLEAGAGEDRDIEVIGSWLERVTDGNRCYLAVQEQVVVSSLLRAFPDEFAAHLEGSCPRPRPVALPKLVDITDDGVPVYDERHYRKQPDWTYLPG